MQITTAVPIAQPGLLSWFVKCTIEGMAYGCVPSFRQWGLPPLYQSGVRYAYERNHGSGREDFALPLTVYRRGWADCDDACIWRIGELAAAGVQATCRTLWRQQELHVLVRFPDGRLEDPSLILMGRK